MTFKNPWGKGNPNFDRWSKNNPWEGGNAEVLSTTSLEKALTDDTGNLIILTEAFQASIVYRVYAKLLENSVFQRFLAPFKISDEHNLTFDFDKMDDGRGLSAQTEVKDENTENIIITMNGNEKFYRNSIKDGTVYKVKPADIYIAKTLIHEAIHAYIAVNGYQYPWTGAPGPVQEHNFMATDFRKDIVDGLREFAEENLISMLETDLEAISWAGLDGSIAWDKLTPELQRDYITRFVHFSMQVFHSINGKVVQNDAETYGGNLLTPEQAATRKHVTK